MLSCRSVIQLLRVYLACLPRKKSASVYVLDHSANLEGRVSSGKNLNDIFTGKTSQNGKKFLGELSMRQKQFKTAKILQAI